MISDKELIDLQNGESYIDDHTYNNPVHSGADVKISQSGGVVNGKVRLVLELTCIGGNQKSVMDIIFVGDKSGSMNGTPLTLAKLCADYLIDYSYPDNTRFMLMSFNDNAIFESPLLCLDDDNKTLLKSQNHKMNAGGGTDLLIPLTKIKKVIENRNYTYNDCAVIMVTDGDADSTGLQPMSHELSLYGSVHAIGLGDYHNSDTVQLIGGNNYHYVKDAERLAETLGGIISHVVDPKIHVQVKSTNGRVNLLEFGTTLHNNGNIDCGTIYAGASKKIIAEIDIGDEKTINFDITVKDLVTKNVYTLTLMHCVQDHEINVETEAQFQNSFAVKTIANATKLVLDGNRSDAFTMLQDAVKVVKDNIISQEALDMLENAKGSIVQNNRASLRSLTTSVTSQVSHANGLARQASIAAQRTVTQSATQHGIDIDIDDVAPIPMASLDDDTLPMPLPLPLPLPMPSRSYAVRRSMAGQP
jgi:Mg-chelatase subunit ChlD